MCNRVGISLRFYLEACFTCLLFIGCNHPGAIKSIVVNSPGHSIVPDKNNECKDTVFVDTALYNQKLLELVHNKPSRNWPVKAAYPRTGAILPFKRIVAYYGNLYSKGMGILGALPSDQMLKKLQEEAKRWQQADSATPVCPALHYIAVTAQRSPGAGNKYRLRMPAHQVDSIIALARAINALVFLDIQPGQSTLQEEIPVLKEYLLLPHVHLGIDPEYSMKNGEVPCNTIGTLDAAAINYAADYLAGLVKEHDLPPKILVVHRFTNAMVTNHKKIKTCSEVQIVLNMDGFGYPAKKIDTYNQWIAGQPVQFTGFKLFYKQDIADKRWPTLMTPAAVLKLYPQPVYIQYQ